MSGVVSCKSAPPVPLRCAALSQASRRRNGSLSRVSNEFTVNASVLLAETVATAASADVFLALMSSVHVNAHTRQVLRTLLPNTKRLVQDCPAVYRGTLLTRNSAALGHYRRTMPRALWWSEGGELFLVSEVPLYPHTAPWKSWAPGVGPIVWPQISTCPCLLFYFASLLPDH